MTLTALLGVARSALTAQSAGLAVTGQNIANLNTTGYVRRTALLAARGLAPASQGGVDFAGVTRSFDRIAHGHVVTEGGKSAAAAARLGALERMESIVEPGTGHSISDRVTALLSSFSTLAAAPDDSTSRSVVLDRADQLASAVSERAGALGALRGELLGEAQTRASEINERLGSIAALNEQIAKATAFGDAAGDLRDRRDELVREVGERIDVHSIEDAFGRVTLASAGTTVLDGSVANSVSVSLDGAGAMRICITTEGGSNIDVTSHITAGSLAGLREARDIDAPKSLASLDALAYELGSSMNALHQSGVGLDALSGRPLFTPSASVAGAAYAMAVDPSVKGQPEHLAAASSAGSLPGGNETALALAGLATKPLGANTSPADAAAAISVEVGQSKQTAAAEASLREDTLSQSRLLSDQHTGVSIDEEMVNLSRYQRAFEAATRVLRTADELLEGLIKEL